MKVLIACEESQKVCKEFRIRGHEAYSCDLLPCGGGHKEWHIQGDALQLIDGHCVFQTMDGEAHKIIGRWDLLIAHPPCTYLTNGGAVRMFRREFKEFQPYGTFQMVNVERLKKGIEARDFFMAMLKAKCEMVAIENPTPMSVYMLPKASQIIQPWAFGDPYSKRTCLWLRNLPPLMPTEILGEYQPYINGGGGRLERKNYKDKTFATSSRKRSETFTGIAKAMAEQWGG